MKILYHHRTRSKDGQYVHIEEMIDALRKQGHEVIIVAPPSAESEAFGADAGLVAWLKRHLPKWFYELMELAYSLVAYRRLSRAVRLHRPDCLYERYNLFLPAGIWLKRRYKLPMLLEVNAPIFEERARYDGLSLKRLARWSQGYAWRNADYVLPVTQVLGDIVASYGVARERIVVIPNGINEERFAEAPDAQSAKAALGLQNKLVLGFTGFVRDWHGLDKVIDLIAQDPPASSRHLLVVGDGPVRAALEQQARDQNISQRVTFTGIVGRDDVARYVAAFDIALQPAVVAYASPLKLFEYLALGKAIVGPAQPNLMEILTDGHNAVLFDPDHSHGLPQAISRLCGDAALRQEIGDNARKTIAAQKLTWQGNAARAIGLFKNMRHA
ncbi:glycosyltransferase family 4 protein [Janthinobacterium sp. 17J80-10]|uniref:glycosyltransferase family 4 protein n=1 Tax=Janthinobacterium sp. 17J80-10 TaxID=2497863 RepID=UPI0010054CD3|nr:glycosyltransferase family 4 protein [Janthinobacterium sp. 17J80-10]QAU35402.1 glycosyltransferase family 1 protein [Janthinobacterium sp. 17J80-10]